MSQTAAEAGPATAFTAWQALGMLIQLVVTDPGQLPAARRMLTDDLAELDAACSRFRPDSELVTLGSAAREADGPVTATVSRLVAGSSLIERQPGITRARTCGSAGPVAGTSPKSRS